MILALTGATGFVGRAVLEAACVQGISIRALTRRPQPACAGVEWIEGDLGNGEALLQLAQGADAMLHIAALTNAPHAEAFESANVAGTAAVITACEAAGVERLIFVSSLSAREPGLSVYGSSKARAEERVRQSNTDWTIVRPPAVYGPGDKDMLDLFRAAKWGIVPLPPAGRTSLIHVADLAAALLAVSVESGLVHKVLEPDDGQPGGYRHEEMAQLMGEVVGRAVIPLTLPEPLLRLAAQADRFLRGDGAKLTPDRVGYMVHPDWVCDSSRAIPSALWTPKVKAREGFRQTVNWYRDKGWL